MSKNNLIIITSAVLILVLSVGGYFVYSNPKNSTPKSWIESVFMPENPKKAEIKAEMDKNYGLPVSAHLTKYKDKTIKLENGKTQNELTSILFRSEKIENQQLLFDAGGWQIYFWSQNPELKPKIDNFKIHGITHQHAQNNNLENKKMKANVTSNYLPPISKNVPEKTEKYFEPYQKSATQIVIKVGDKFETLNYKHILAMTGFETETQMLDFVLIQHKLLGQNKIFWFRDTDKELDYKIYKQIPLLFLQDYNFDNQRKTSNVEGVQFEEKNKFPFGDMLPNSELENDKAMPDYTLNFGCYQKYQNNLKVNINPGKKIEYFTHPNSNSLTKVKLKLENGNLKLEIKNELDCNQMINC